VGWCPQSWRNRCAIAPERFSSMTENGVSSYWLLTGQPAPIDINKGGFHGQIVYTIK